MDYKEQVDEVRENNRPFHHKSHLSTLNSFHVIARYGGIWSDVKESSTLRRYLFFVYIFSMNSFTWIFTVTILADLLSNCSNLLIAIEDSCMLAGASLVVFKSTVFHIRRKEIINLINRIYEPVDFLAKSSEPLVYVLMKNYVYCEKALEYGFFLGATFLGGAFMLQNPMVNGSLPIRAQYPFDTIGEPGHSIAVFSQGIGVSAALYAIAGIDGIARSLCRYISFQLEILNINFQHCLTKWPCSRFDSTGKTSSITNPDFHPNCFVLFHPDEAEITCKSFLERLKLCIHHHQRLIKIVEDFNHTIGSSLFMQALTSTLMICLTGFQALLLAEDSTDLVGSIVYLCVAFTHLATWCWFGHMLIYQSDKLSDSIWFSGWEDEFNPDTTHLMEVSLRRAKRVLRLRAGDLWTLSMETFVMILKTSYSVFALLSAVVVEDGRE